ncbi:hypothetical protein D3C84_904200 [compost metagenome]
MGPLVVGIGEDQDVPCTAGDGAVQGRGLALAGQVEHAQARVVHPLRAGHGVVGRAVAGENDLQRQRLIILGQHAAQFRFDVPGFVVGGNDHTDIQRLGVAMVPRGEQRREHGQQQRVAEVGVDRQQQAQPEQEFSHGPASWRSNDTG